MSEKFRLGREELKTYFNLSPQIVALYQKSSAQTNSFSMKIASILIFIFELFNMFRVLVLSNSGLSTLNNRIYFIMYLFLFGSAVVFLVVEKMVSHDLDRLNRLYVSAAYVWVIWHAVLNGYDIYRDPENGVMVLSTALFAYAICAQLPPRHSVIALSSATVLFLATSYQSLPSGSVLNIVIATGVVLFISVRNYMYRVRTIMQSVEIEQINQQLKLDQEKLKISLEKYEIVLNYTNDAVFEIDFAQKTLRFSNTTKIRDEDYRKIDHISSWMKTQEIICHDDKADFMTQVNAIVHGSGEGEITFRIAEESELVWYRLRFFVQYNEDHQPVQGLGLLENIDAEQKHLENLSIQTKNDPMTGLLNTIAFQDCFIQEIQELQDDEYMMMFMIDLDNFKQINDNYGHFSGDLTLKAVAELMRAVFREYDVLGRLGGDEFAVLITGVKDISIAKMKAEQFLHEMKKLHITDHQFAVSCSVGIAITNDKKIHYDVLYSNADVALYQAKDEGKSRYCIHE